MAKGTFSEAGRARTDDDQIMSSEAMTASRTSYAYLCWQLQTTSVVKTRYNGA